MSPARSAGDSRLPRPAVVFVNPASGPDDTDVAAVSESFPGFDVRETEPGRLAAQVQAAIDDGATVVGIAGGDGSISTAAAALVGTRVSLLPIPAGTRNHFAHDVGIDTIDDARKAAEGSATTDVDVGAVNGETFVNNASLGLYTDLVRRRERHQRRTRKSVANLLAAWEVMRHGHHVTVKIDDQPLRVWAVFVGNGKYGTGPLDVSRRESLRDGELDVRVVLADRRLARLRVASALLFGRLDASPLVRRVSASTFAVDLARRSVDVALDGEVVALTPPLSFESLTGVLRVIVP
jgi:diacylglycerol kinase family enzyme